MAGVVSVVAVKVGDFGIYSGYSRLHTLLIYEEVVFQFLRGLYVQVFVAGSSQQYECGHDQYVESVIHLRCF